MEMYTWYAKCSTIALQEKFWLTVRLLIPKSVLQLKFKWFGLLRKCILLSLTRVCDDTQVDEARRSAD